MMTHDQEIESHPFFKKHFEGKSIKEYHEMPHGHGSLGYHQWTAHHGIGLTPVKHKLFHRYYPEANHHSVAITSGTEGKNILGNHIYHSGEGEGNSATEALEKAIHQYKNDHGFHLQENTNHTSLAEFKAHAKRLGYTIGRVGSTKFNAHKYNAYKEVSPGLVSIKGEFVPDRYSGSKDIGKGVLQENVNQFNLGKGVKTTISLLGKI